MKDFPSDQASRWSSDSNIPPQFILLKLERASLIESITFGKYEKTHVCNLKKFCIYGGLHPENLVELLNSGLKNDNQPETFSLKHLVEGKMFPCRYIKIVPVQSWGPSFNFSIWYVELMGTQEWDAVKPCIQWYNAYREREAIRLCLKHLRQNQCLEAFECLQKRTKVQLEDPLLSELHWAMVVKGDYEATEQLLHRAVDNGLFGPYIHSQDYVPEWSRILPCIDEDPCHRPGMRGGHQMCIDTNTETVYLFGGWDGVQDLNDLWSYSVPNNTWTLLSNNTEEEGGPSARSCHKMCLDQDHRQLFCLGRYLDSQHRHTNNLKSDFYMYDIEQKKWHLICEDTAVVGGPKLIFDHQMCLDPEKRTIYVFGGRILSPAPGYPEERGLAVASSSGVGGAFLSEPQFSGLYAYHIPTSTWRLLRDDPSGSPGLGPIEMRSRIGHSMLFHPIERKLFIFAGQRSKEYLNDFFTYNVDTGEVTTVTDGTRRRDPAQIPAAGFTQRATIDHELNEIYILSGLSKDKDKRDDNVKNSFWVYNIVDNKWTCVYRNDSSREKEADSNSKMPGEEPCPRFAHQLVYDHVKKAHYLFGGNPGRSNDPKMRLDDFWSLRLCRPSQSQLLTRCQFLIRKCQFRELTEADPIRAMFYLQNNLSAVVDRTSDEQMAEFHRLTNLLFRTKEQQEEDELLSGKVDNAESTVNSSYRLRSSVFDALARFFPDYMAQPRFSLTDFVAFDKA
ncbi:hypothetical protein GHT06_014315 [Daphnia sinensis]|uniref:F5/8 type C domain-containing protein n=1 Tax=Daphnia sinensis TaxID=1820382 RepID=A0AAD5LE91_9CRUS|nr:hypothetical protein GHT06_014315 [Daphnia sinensis]